MELENVVDSGEGLGSSGDVAVDSVAENTGTEEAKQPSVLAKGIVAGDSVRLVLNPQTGKREVVIADPEVQEDSAGDDNGVSESDPDDDHEVDAGTEDNEENVPTLAKVDQKMQAAKTNLYTAQELNLALSLGTVDESRIAPEHTVEYGRFKARQEFVRNQQAQAEADRQSALAGKSDAELRQEYHTMVENMAQEYALEELGFKDMEELEAAEFGEDEQAKSRVKMYRNSLETHRLNILHQAQMKAEEQARERDEAERERQQVAGEVKSFLEANTAKEPSFQSILTLMESRYKNLPRGETEEIAEAMSAAMRSQLQRKHLPVLQKYYEDTRVAFYAEKNKVSTVPQAVKKKQPAKVEKPGGGADTSASKPNPKDLRNMSHMDKTKWFEQFA